MSYVDDDTFSIPDFSTERFNLSTFERQYTVYTRGRVGKRMVDEADPKFQLPNSSTVHLVNHFLDPQDNLNLTPFFPPMLQHETYPVYRSFVTTLPSGTDTPFPVGDRYIFTRGRVSAQTLSYFRNNHREKRLVSERTLGNKSNILVVKDYSSLHQVRIQGTMRVWRQTDIILRTILQTVVDTPFARNHYIYLPLSDTMYSRANVIRTFGKIDQTTTHNSNDPSLVVLSNILGYAYGHSHTVDFPVMANDRQVVSEDGTTPEWLDTPTNSLLWRIPEEKQKYINFIFQHSGKVVIYNLAELAGFAKTGASFFNSLLREFQTLQLHASGANPEHIEDMTDDEVDAHVEIRDNSFAKPVPNSHPDSEEAQDNQKIHDEGDDLPTPAVPPMGVGETSGVVPLHHEDPEPTLDVDVKSSDEKRNPVLKEVKVDRHRETSLPFTASYHGKLEEYLRSLTDTQRKRAEKLIERQRSVLVGGRTLEEHALRDIDPLPAEEYSVNRETHPDPSTQSSVITRIDKHYLDTTLHQDMARTFLAFTKHGFFVNSIKENVTKDRMNHTRNYRVEFVHVDGTRHLSTVVIPQPDKDGNLLSKGIKYRMTKQMIANPICKISPTRVNLASDYNKSIVERISTQRGSFTPYLLGIVAGLVKDRLATVEYGRSRPDETVLPYEYSILASRYDRLTIPSDNGYKFVLRYENRMDGFTPAQIDTVLHQETKYGVYCGKAPNGNLLFWDMDDQIHALTTKGVHITSTPHFIQVLAGIYPDRVEKSVPYEYTTAQIIDMNYPLVYIFGLIKGLSWVLETYKAQTRWVPRGKSLSMAPTDLRIRFKDGSLIFNRYPLETSLILSGLSWCNTTEFDVAEFDKPDAYYKILELKGASTNRLKGVVSFVELFVGPITEDILRELNEPTDTISLLRRANALLTYQSHYQASSVRHHRLRGYERMASIVYNELARRYATYQTQRGRAKQFTIKPDAVYLRIINDATTETVETNNPLQEIRALSRASYAGLGGRSGRSFVIEDRKYPNDGVGTISEGTPDSGKVGLNFNTSFNPNIMTLRGTMKPYEPGDTLGGGNLFSVAPLMFAGSAQDDAKRVSFVSHQMAHHVPCKNSDLNRVRTGAEASVASMVSSAFAVVAPGDGTVTHIDNDHCIMEFTPAPVVLSTTKSLDTNLTTAQLTEFAKHQKRVYLLCNKVPGAVGDLFNLKSGKVGKIANITAKTDPADLPEYVRNTYKGELKSSMVLLDVIVSEKSYRPKPQYFEFGIIHTTISGAKLRQDLVPNVIVNEKVSKGDILIYNEGFFSPAPDPWDPAGKKGVNWNHGVLANVLLQERTDNYEDACTTWSEFAKKLDMVPAHTRYITVDGTDAIEDLVNVGQTVSSIDSLCTIRNGDITDLTDDDSDGASFFFDALTKKPVRAKYAGRIASIEFIYAADPNQLSDSLKKLIRSHEARKRKLMTLSKESGSEFDVHSGYIAPGTKYKGVEFTPTTVMIEITIEETYPLGQADKLCIMTACKATVSNVYQEKIVGVESGTEVDAVFSVTSPFKRMTLTPFINGKANRILEDAEKQFVKLLLKR